MATQPAASDRVFRVPELLEQILLNFSRNWTKHMEVMTLINCMRVSKAFNDTITGSTLLRQALFLELPPKDDAREWLDSINILLYLNLADGRVPQGRGVSVRRMFDTVPIDYSRMKIQLELRPGVTASRACYDEASWRRMYLLKRNYTVVVLKLHTTGECRSITGKWSNPTMGELVDAALSSGVGRA